MSVEAATMQQSSYQTTHAAASPKALLQAKQLRKLAEEDAVRLANRIEQLKKEEMKALKKITDTRRRAEEIAALRERNAKAKLEKQKREVEQQEEIAKQSKVMQKLKKEHIEKKLKSQEILAKKKGEAVIQTKVARAQNERTKEEQRIADRKRALEMKAKVREQQNVFRQKAASTKALHLQETHDQYEKRTLRELALKEEKEKELEKMAKLEMELIVTLQKRQREQEKAIKELEEALAADSRSRMSSPTRTMQSSASTRSRDPGTDSRSASRLSSTKKSLLQGEDMTSTDIPEPSDEEIQAQFTSLVTYDSEGKGKIDTSELSDLLQKLGLQLDSQQMSQCQEQLDPRSSGKVQYDEFLEWWHG